MTANAKRQKKFRDSLKAKGLTRYTMQIPTECLDMLKRIRVMDNDPMETIDEYMVVCLMKGLAFNFNSGNGIKITKSEGRYQVTGPAGA